MKVYDKKGDLSRGKAFVIVLFWVNTYCTVYVLLQSLLYGTPLVGWLLVCPIITAATVAGLLIRWLAKAAKTLAEPKRHGIIPAETICRVMGGK